MGEIHSEILLLGNLKCHLYTNTIRKTYESNKRSEEDVSKDALMKSVFGQTTTLVHTDDYNSSSCHYRIR